MKIERFEDLEIWQESRELCKKVSDITRNGEFSKDFKFRDQIRDSSGSTMDCIAEGFERDGVREFIQLLSTAKGSCGETRSQSYRAYDNGYISQEQLDDMIERTVRLSKKIATFMKYLKNSGFRGTKFR